MSALSDKIANDALSLPADMRLSLIEKLLKSLNIPTQPEIDALWAKEAERRIAEVENGDVNPIPGEHVFSDIRKRLRG